MLIGITNVEIVLISVAYIPRSTIYRVRLVLMKMVKNLVSTIIRMNSWIFRFLKN